MPPSDLAPPPSAEQAARFEELGEDYVRVLAVQWSPPQSHQAQAWLKAKREDHDRQEAANRAAQGRVAQKTLRWAVVAAVTSCIAAFIAAAAWLAPIK